VISKAVPARARTRTFAIGVDYVTAHTHQRAIAAAGITFEGGVSYASAPEKAAWVHLRGVMSVETAALEMEAVAALSRQCRDPRPSREQVVSDAERLLKVVGMDDHQYVLAAHIDTDDFHAHVIANRVGPDGRANDLWHERINRERVCAEIAAERGWDIVVGHHNRDIVQRIERFHDLPPEPEQRLSDGAYRQLHERGVLPWQDVSRPYILDAVDRASGWHDLHQRLVAHGVIVKLVQRGDRVQGLAFAEGLDRTAPGCAASRVDARCALGALERRLGAYIAAHEAVLGVAQEHEAVTPWSDKVRPTILTAVDASQSWDDLKARLDEYGIVIKLVERGGRVQGLAFVQGSDPNAPGCSATRIDPRCKLGTLEQRFGHFPLAAQQRQEPHEQQNERHAEGGARRRTEGMRERAERDARSNPDRGRLDADYVIANARLRSAYRAYRDRFFADRQMMLDEHRNAAWARERAQRQLEAQRRRESRQLMRATARFSTRGLLAHQVAYWVIDGVIAHRRAQEGDRARVRWAATKIVLASERGLSREEKAMDYRSFVTEQARAGDAGAQRVQQTLAPKSREQRRTPYGELRRLALDEIRTRLERIRLEEEARYQYARTEREQLKPVARPSTLDDTLAAERRRIEERVADATQFKDAERSQLQQLAAERRSWNPLTRAAATKAEAELQVVRRTRFDKALTVAMREFDERDVPQLVKRLTADERRYQEYVASSLALEGDMRDAHTILRSRLPHVNRCVNTLQHAGVTHIEAYSDSPSTRFIQLAAAVEEQYQALPEAVRREAERELRREQQTRERSRESLAMWER
jgi:hypothetical protein